MWYGTVWHQSPLINLTGTAPNPWIPEWAHFCNVSSRVDMERWVSQRLYKSTVSCRADFQRELELEYALEACGCDFRSPTLPEPAAAPVSSSPSSSAESRHAEEADASDTSDDRRDDDATRDAPLPDDPLLPTLYGFLNPRVCDGFKLNFKSAAAAAGRARPPGTGRAPSASAPPPDSASISRRVSHGQPPPRATPTPAPIAFLIVAYHDAAMLRRQLAALHSPEVRKRHACHYFAVPCLTLPYPVCLPCPSLPERAAACRSRRCMHADD